MTEADQCRAKSEDLLKRAAQSSNLGESSSLIQQAMTWHFRAIEAEKAESVRADSRSESTAAR